MRMCRVLRAACCVLALLVHTVMAQPGKPLATTTVGMEGKVVFRYDGAAVRALPADDRAAVVVRIAEQAVDGGHTLYDLRFIAQRAGDYDLRSFLQHFDGSAVTDGEAMPVHVDAVLPESAGADLVEVQRVGAVKLGGYKTVLIAIGAAWVVPPVWVIVKRMRRRKKTAPPVVAAPVTLADQLRPLVTAALAGELSTAERARLEMMLVGYWRERLGLEEVETEEVFGKLRGDPEAGALVVALEGWLHSPEERRGDVGELLRPYEKAAAVHANRTPSLALGPGKRVRA